MIKIFISVILALVLISVAGTVSAGTLIAGKIYDSPDFETAGPVAGANINVTCNNNSLTTQSLNDGTYSVVFNSTNSCPNISCPDFSCPNNSNVTVVAESGGITNSGNGIVHDYTAIMPDLYVGIVNIALIPEFGFYVGALTLLGAVGVFFLVRRK